MSFLLKSTQGIDTELDAFFKSQPGRPLDPISTPVPTQPSRKRKLENPKQDGHSKRSKPDASTKKARRKVRILEAQPAEEEKDDEDNSDVGASYSHGKATTVQKSDSEPEDSEGEENPSTLIHEFLADKGKNKSRHRSKQKYVPPDESSDQRDRRTIFIGNLPLEVAQKKPLQKQLQRHILSLVPAAKIESIRFRSIPFSTPTSQLPEDATKPEHKAPHKNPSQRDHGRDRASSWRQHHEPDGNTAKKDEKTYLNPNQKKKVAFINQEFHSTADTVHAYLIFAHPVPKEDRPENLPPLPPCMDPYEAAKEAVRKADGTLFLERMLRVDLIGKKTASEEGENVDPKLTLFVGNLDLASKEEDLRAFFECLMKKERGDPPDVEEEEVEGEEAKKLSTWVTRIRIVRDKDTQLGKGFGYVQFIDRECVDEILTMDVSHLKFAKRKLRVQRCKTIPGTKLPSSVKLNAKTVKPKADKQNEKSHSRTQTSLPKPTPITVPKGDPLLGEKLVNLSKDQRKKIKAGDTDRVARRLAKKKARMAMGTHKDRHGEDSGEKKRERVRKGSRALLEKKRKDVKKKGRAMSEKSLQKRNVKK